MKVFVARSQTSTVSSYFTPPFGVEKTITFHLVTQHMPLTVRFSEETARSPSVSTTPRRWSLAASEDDAVSSRGSDNLNEKIERLSLALNYLPAKFSTPQSPRLRYRQCRGSYIPGAKPGGGRVAFKVDEPRMPALDENEEGAEQDPGTSRKRSPTLRWNRFKWTLFLSNTIVSNDYS